MSMFKEIQKDFDATWFAEKYKEKIPADLLLKNDPQKLFTYYVQHVKEEGFSPNSDFDEELYRNLYADVSDTIKNGQINSGFAHYLQFGKKEGRISNKQSIHSLAKGTDAIKFDNIMFTMRMMFDPAWYKNEYQNHEAIAGEGLELSEMSSEDLFRHYIINSKKNLFSPNEFFNERYYLYLHEDVAKGIRDGKLINGYEHFLIVGRYENRVCSPKIMGNLTKKYPGITDPVGISVLEGIVYRIRPIPFIVKNTKKKINIMLPTLDPDVMFGGYISIHNLIKKIVDYGFDVRIIVFEDNEDINISLLKIKERGSIILKILEHTEICNVTKRDKTLIISANDKFIVYNAWGVPLAHEIVKKTNTNRVIYFVQEYEAIFHDNCSIRTIMEDAFNYQNFYIINSQKLLNFFQKRGIGNLHNAIEGIDYLCFEHALSEVSPSLSAMDERDEKRFLFYARPEAHAKRNLFELGIIALRKAIKTGFFDDDSWSFHGIGTLGTKYDIGLSDIHNMEIVSKIENAKYSEMLRTFDLGMSLMFAPHPSVVPYEMAKSGMVVVTNTYENRSESDLKSISSNIVPAFPSINGIANAIMDAVPMVYNFENRIRGAEFAMNTSWDEAFNDDFMKKLSEILK